MIYFEELINTAKHISKPKPRVLTVGGSPRAGGNTDTLIKQISLGIEEKITEVSHIKLKDINPQGCIGCEKCRKDKVCTMLYDGMSALYPDIIESQGLVLVSPVHNYNITSWMKAFIDRLYCFYNFNNNTRPREWNSRLANQHRKVVIAAVCEQASMQDMGFAIEAMQKPMEALGYEIVGTLPALYSFEKGAVTKQQEVMEQALLLGRLLGQSLTQKIQ
jgi:multimeric flavodoxin WrbA